MELKCGNCEKLWAIIDDIDTYSDMAKGDDKLYRSLVERRQRDRFKDTNITTDGYTLKYNNHPSPAYEKLVETLKRLASNEAFTSTRVCTKEETARMKFAQQALAEIEGGG